MTYDPHKKYKRVGECRHCGRCCDSGCPYFRFEANRDIRAGERFGLSEIGIEGAIMAICTVHDNPEKRATVYGGSCVDVPTHPLNTFETCGFKWVEEE